MKLAHLATCLVLSAACHSGPELPPPPPDHVATIPAPRNEEWWTQRNALLEENAHKGNPELLFLGDSITQGWEGAGRDVWSSYYGDRGAVNLGIGGDRTQHVLWRILNGNLPEGVAPKLAVLMIGTNNSSSDTSEEIADGVRAIVRTLWRELRETEILVLAIFPRGAEPGDPLRSVNEGVNAIIAKLPEQYADGRVHYLDIGEAFLEEDGTLTKEIMPDLLHLSPQGYQIWAESIEPTVAELYGD